MVTATNGIDYSKLFPVSTSSSNAGANILSALYGGSSSGTSSIDPITALQIAQQNQAQDVKNEENEPQVQVAIQAFTKAVNSATSITQLLGNQDFLNVFLTANGLGDDVDYTGLAQKALMSDPSDDNSLANQLTSTSSQWQAIVETYNFSANGLSALQNSSVIATIASGYAEVQWRDSLDQQTPGLSNALYFLQNASSLTTADQVLGNSIARSVVTTAFGIPAQIAYQPLQAQEDVINQHLDFSKMSDSKYVQQITDQYLVMNQSSSSSTSSNSYLTSLFA